MRNSKSNMPGLIILLLFISMACTKEKKEGISATFIKTYQCDSENYPVYIQQLGDNGFLIYASEGAGKPLLMRTDIAGNLIWKKTIDQYCFSVKGGWWYTPGNDGTHILFESGQISTDMDTSGNILHSGSLLKYSNNAPFYDAGSYYVLPSTNGWQTYKPGLNYLIRCDKNLNLSYYYTFDDAILGGKTLYYFCYGARNDGTFNIWGVKFPRNNWSWGDNYKIFAARINPIAGTAKQIMIDTADQQTNDNCSWQALTPDSGVVGVSVRNDVTNRATYPSIVMFDKDINLVWKNAYPLAGYTIFAQNIHVCKDGGYIVVGNVSAFGDKNSSPYAMKVDHAGRKLWDKIIPTSGSGIFINAIDTKDGGYAFIGSTSGFGNGLKGTQALFVKTDANGNY